MFRAYDVKAKLLGEFENIEIAKNVPNVMYIYVAGKLAWKGNDPLDQLK